MLTCCVCAGAWAQTQGTLNVPEVNRKAGPAKQAIIVKKSATSREGVVKIQLTTNGANYRDMKFDLTLPEGISLVNTTEDPVVKVDAINDKNHVLFYALEGEGQIVKIAVVDNVVNLAENTQSASAETYGKYLAGDNDGIVFELPIKATADFTDVKNANIANLAFTDDAATADIPATAEPFGIAMIQLGDVNDNGEVELNDAIAIAKFGINANPIPFVADVADFNDDTDIALNDAIAIAKSVITTSAKENLTEVEVVENIENIENDYDPE